VRAVLLLGSTEKYRIEQVAPATRTVGTGIEHTFQTDGQVLESGMYLTVSPEIYYECSVIIATKPVYQYDKGILNIGKSNFFPQF
jgi:hypothetical protein